jgi:hypothetical protein
MEYQLEIYRPGSCDSDACIKTLTAATAFLPIRSGDLIKTEKWEVSGLCYASSTSSTYFQRSRAESIRRVE